MEYTVGLFLTDSLDAYLHDLGKSNTKSYLINNETVRNYNEILPSLSVIKTTTCEFTLIWTS